jgi:putative peptidoglycan lipid II flippase
LGMTCIVILSVWYLSDRMGIHSLSAGLLSGQVLAVLALGAVAIKVIPKITGASHPLLSQVTARMPWFVAIEVVGLSLVFIDRFLANRMLSDGIIASLNYARILNEVPFQALALTFVTAVFPELAARFAKKDREGFRRMLLNGARGIIVVMVPIATLLVLLRYEVVSAIYQRGEFGVSDTQITADALAVYAIGLPFLGIASLSHQASYAAGRYRMLLVVRVISLAVKIAISWFLLPKFGHLALAAGTSAFVIVQALITSSILLGGLKGLVPKPGWLLLATVVGGAAGLGISRGLDTLGWFSSLGLVQQGIAWAGALILFWLTCRAGHLEEIRWVEERFKRNRGE